MATRTVVILNPRSQGGAAGKRWTHIADLIRRHLPFEHAVTNAPGHAIELARDALAAGADQIIALGGDGTINEVVNGFFDSNGVNTAPGASFGVLPFGTGGDFRRTFGLPTDIEAAAKVIAAGHIRRIDVGRVEYTRHPVDGEGMATRMYPNIASFGISGVVDRMINKSKKRLGSLSFALATARATLSYQNKRVHLRFDDSNGATTDLTINTVAIANGQFFGGGMHIAPEAEPDDGFFDVVALGDFSLSDLILRGGRLYKGTHLTMDKVSQRRATIVDARSADPGVVVEIDLDGENVGQLPARFTMCRAALNMIVPAAP